MSHLSPHNKGASLRVQGLHQHFQTVRFFHGGAGTITGFHDRELSEEEWRGRPAVVPGVDLLYPEGSLPRLESPPLDLKSVSHTNTSSHARPHTPLPFFDSGAQGRAKQQTQRASKEEKHDGRPPGAGRTGRELGRRGSTMPITRREGREEAGKGGSTRPGASL